MIDGVRIADRALAALRGSTSSQVVVANDPSAHSWFPSDRLVADETPGWGPLAGIATARAAANGDAVIVLAWDMPFVPAALLEELCRIGCEGAAISAVVPVHDAIAEPLCAWYSPAALPICRSLLAAGERRAGALATRLPRTVWLEEAAVARFGDAGRLFTSVDTPEGLAALGGALP
jgi:molybdopterin-guanine dinucleotide biosynthesis protein A